MANIEFYSGAIDASGCVSNGWNLVKQNYGLFLGITLVAMIIAGCIPWLQSVFGRTDNGRRLLRRVVRNVVENRSSLG